MKGSLFKTPPTPCAFHDNNVISHFCRADECLLPLCRDCLPIHRKQHSSKSCPMDTILIQDQASAVHRAITHQIAVLDEAFSEISSKLALSNQLHVQLRTSIFKEQESLMQAIGLYYDSMRREVELNFQRRHHWLHEVTRQYQSIREEMLILQERLQGEKHLRTIIMWNRLHPEEYIAEIQRQSKKQLEPPSLVPCDAQRVVNFMSQMQSMVVLDLQGDMGFAQLGKVLYTLRFGPQESSVTSIPTIRTQGITLISKGKPAPTQRLSLCKSAQKI